MKITDAKVIVCSPGRNFVTLKITTEDGIYGLGDATLNGRELAVASYLSDHVIPLLIGRDARRIEDIWQYLYKGAYWRRGPVTMCSVAAVDTALWDIKGKSLNAPVYQLLGGASRDGVLVYGHASGKDIEDTVKAVAEYRKLGYKAIRAQSGISGLQSIYGVGRGKMYYEPAEKDAPHEDAWSSDLYLNFVIRAASEGIWRGSPPAARCASPADAHRSGTPRKEPRTISFVLAGRSCASRASGKSASDPPAYHHAYSDRRGFQFDLRLPAAHPGAAHRLHSDCRCACRGDFTFEENCEPGRTLSSANWLPRRHGHEPRVHGRGPAFRFERA